MSEVVSDEMAEDGSVEQECVSRGEGGVTEVQDNPRPADLKEDNLQGQHQNSQDQVLDNQDQHQDDQSQHQDDQDQYQNNQNQVQHDQDQLLNRPQDDQDQHVDDQDQPQDNQAGQPQDNQDQPQDNQAGQPQDNQDQPLDNQDQPQDNQDQLLDNQAGQPQDNQDQPQDNQDQPQDNQDQPQDNQAGQPQDNQDQPQDNQDQPQDNKDQPQADQHQNDQHQPQDNQGHHDQDGDQSDSESGSYGTPDEDEGYRMERRRRRGSKDSEEEESEGEGEEKGESENEEEADEWEERAEDEWEEEEGAKQSQEGGLEDYSTKETDEQPKDSPMFVPMKGKFFQHDDRLQSGDEGEETQLPVEPSSKADAVDHWEHDLYIEEEQGPRQSWEKEGDERIMQAMERRKREREASDKDGRGGMQLRDFVRPRDRDRFDSGRGGRDRARFPRRGRDDRDQEGNSWRPQTDDQYQPHWEGSGRGSQGNRRGFRGRGRNQPDREGGNWSPERRQKWTSEKPYRQRQEEGWERQSRAQRQTRNDEDNHRGRDRERRRQQERIADEGAEAPVDTSPQESSTFAPVTSDTHQFDKEEDSGKIDSMVVTANGVEIKSPPGSGTSTTRREERSPRTMFHVGSSTEPKTRQTKVFSLTKESTLVIKSDERKPKRRGRGRGWREKLVPPKVGGLQSDVTVIESLDLRLPSEQTGDSQQIESVPGLPCVGKNTEPAHAEDQDQTQPPEPTTKKTDDTATPSDEVQNQVSPISQQASVNQGTKPKRYSSQRQTQKTPANEEGQEMREPPPQQQSNETPWPPFVDPTQAFAQHMKMMHLSQSDPSMDATVQAMLYQNPALHQHVQYMWLQHQQQQQNMMRMHQEYVNTGMPMNYPQQPMASVEHEGLPAQRFPFRMGLYIPPLAPEDQMRQPPPQKSRSQAIPIVPPKE